ncbi:GAF domain-containing sensor histidine kinase [Mucilaginibacter sp. KACC 22773]|uniref:GAF domain-containing sensor histidine kinase n=1 Tax=Mucilaginibacter sp. KACC 22773 TaxID=3025671 RepID=UPI0023653C1C|nr:GAF domain-containing sensor histidine kinase [Mucilaginibacter sp. KACC 22773]WDF77929.1 GAF domain-containing sensor histidine kinase [Mucilaginibacter sp. KACC 22773]
MLTPPIPENEMDRVMTLSEFDLDYGAHADSFKDLTKLAAKVAGTEMSLVNLIDSYTQWTISTHNMDLEQMPREESVCQYVLMSDENMEIADLSADERFKDRPYVTGGPHLRYYYGIPLNVDNHNIGALCVVDAHSPKTLNPEKIELLKIIAGEIVNRLKYIKVIDDLRNNLSEAKQTQKKVAHDIRGPLSGIIGLAQLIREQGDENQMDEILEFMNLIHRSGRSILELADEILSADKKEKKVPELKGNEFNQVVFKDKLEKLYVPQAMNKHITFRVNTSSASETIPFSKNKLLQITGNLISNAIKFTPNNGSVTVDLDLIEKRNENVLQIKVTDSGVGLDADGIANILQGNATSTNGTGGENGYGFGLALVKHLVESLKGTFNIFSVPGQGATFEVKLPQASSPEK